MRVVVNQLASLGMRTGIGHYAVELLRCLRTQAGNDQIDSFSDNWVRRVARACSRLRPRLEATPDRERPDGWSRAAATIRTNAMGCLRRVGRAVMAQHFRMVCALRGYDLYHEPNYIPLPSDRLAVATIHDLSVFLHPEWHPVDRVAYFEKHFEAGLKRCRHFFAISEFGRQEIIRHLHIAPDQVTRTYMGIRRGIGPLATERVARVLRALNLPSQYLLYLGTIEPRKNVLTLLKAYCSLPQSLRARWPLLLVGSWGWNAGPVAEYIHNEARHKGVIHLGYIAEEHLASIYNGARALVYPTLYEGFGLPPLEMMACGGAVIASTAGAIVETVGGRAHLIDPHDEDSWRAAMARVVEDDAWWQALRQDVMTVAAPFTWEQCAADTLNAYRMVCGGSGRKYQPRQAA